MTCTETSTKNYYDENGFMYAKRNERDDVLYLRCKNSRSENCKASVICRGKVLGQSILSIPHSHAADKKDRDHVKFCKIIETIIEKSPYKNATDVYNEAKDELRDSIEMSHIDELGNENNLHHNYERLVLLVSSNIHKTLNTDNCDWYFPNTIQIRY